MNTTITKKHYKEALQTIADFFEKVDKDIQPLSIIQNGNVGTVGVSDIDLIFVFSDSFSQGKAFSEAYNKAISDIPFKEILFIHNPMLLSESVVRYLPFYTHNPASELKIIFGNAIQFEANEPDKIQALLISLEFIQFRLFQLMNMVMSKNVTQHGILLRGHSMKHSITLAKQAGIDLSDVEFSALGIVENIRKSVQLGKSIELSSKEVQNLAKGIIKEFRVLYRLFASEAEKYISFYLPENSSYQYEQNVTMSDLFAQNKHFTQKISSSEIRVEGMHWINKLMKDLYFGTTHSTAIVAQSDFKEACKKRAWFHKKQWEWNKNIFGTIHAGLSPMPAIIGKESEKHAKEYWGL